MLIKRWVLLSIVACLSVVLSAGNSFAGVMSHASLSNIRVETTGGLTATISETPMNEWYLSSEHGVDFVELEYSEPGISWLDGNNFNLTDNTPNDILVGLDNTSSNFGASGTVSGSKVSGDVLWDDEAISGDGTTAFTFTDLYQSWKIDMDGDPMAKGDVKILVDAVIDIKWDNINLPSDSAYIYTEVSIDAWPGTETMWAEYDPSFGFSGASSGAVVDDTVSGGDMTSGRLRITQTFELDLGEFFSGEYTDLYLDIHNTLVEKNITTPSGTPVPEPGTVFLLSVGIGALGVGKKRKA